MSIFVCMFVSVIRYNYDTCIDHSIASINSSDKNYFYLFDLAKITVFESSFFLQKPKVVSYFTEIRQEVPVGVWIDLCIEQERII